MKTDLKNSTDESLMKAVQIGELNAFNEIYLRYSDRLLYFLYKMLGQDEATAQDILQEIFITIAEAPDKFDCNKNFKTWVFAIAANRCKNHFRDHKNKFTSLPDNFDHQDVFVDTQNENGLEEMQQRLNMAVQKLHPAYKETFVLRYFEGLTNEEITEILDCPLGTVKSRLHNALKILNQELKEFYSQLNL
ncbi:sigma-70 family RNA polymerase sigma factor [Paracrocinitomix mangrovi]|uniref:RNA polymerase sigma factor n=1 Tax=Paracrocinitomix mangrovi TaxID=2862509 RepID=UPI001C8E7CAE|nr:sigma-70 family RNA polymerase sigma factor [Paracrocinitomix mangrovi]UKN03730.1 sigma-70 family RNA polymerase sigma factor [Paracrocinitomix mangrovi]